MCDRILIFARIYVADLLIIIRLLWLLLAHWFCGELVAVAHRVCFSSGLLLYCVAFLFYISVATCGNYSWSQTGVLPWPKLGLCLTSWSQNAKWDRAWDIAMKSFNASRFCLVLLLYYVAFLFHISVATCGNYSWAQTSVLPWPKLGLCLTSWSQNAKWDGAWKIAMKRFDASRFRVVCMFECMPSLH